MKALAGGTGRLDEGAAALTAGAKTLRSGADTLAAGTKKLSGNSEALRNGADTLAAGTDTLAEGIGKLSDGSAELSDGIDKLKTEGLDRIVSFFDEDLGELADTMDAIGDAASAYRSFTGADESMDSHVKFILKADSIGQ